LKGKPEFEVLNGRIRAPVLLTIGRVCLGVFGQ